MRASLVAVLAAACSSSSSSSPPPSGPACADRAAEIATWAAEIAPEGRAVQISGERLAPGPDLPLAVRVDAPQIEITRAGVAVMDEHVAIPDLVAKIAEAHTTYTPDAPPSRVIVAVDADVRIDDVVAVMDVLARAGATDVGLAFLHPGKAKAPPRSSVSAEIDVLRTVPPAGRAEAVAQVAARAIKPCHALDKLFASSAAVPGPDKETYLLHGLGPAVEECDCSLDLDALRSLLWALFGPGIHTPKSLVDITVVGPHDPYDVWVRGGSWLDHAADLRAAKGKRVRFDRLPLMTR